MTWVPSPQRQQHINDLLTVFEREDGKVTCKWCRAMFNGRDVDFGQWALHLKLFHVEAHAAYKAGILPMYPQRKDR